MKHELKVPSPAFERYAADQQRSVLVMHNRDFQAGDSISLVHTNEYGSPKRHWIERDERGRFLNEWRDDEPLTAVITHVLPATQNAAITAGYCLLSIEVTR